MKINFKLFGIALAIMTFTSCFVDDDPRLDNDSGPNLVSFVNSSKVISGIANGNEYENEITLKVKGPTWENMSADVEATVEVDPSSTAIEGTHFVLNSKTITLKAENNYIGKLPITLLTDGITAPLDESPKLILNLVSATGENVINNGKPLKIDLNYLCNSTLGGNYNVKLRYVRSSQGIDETYEFTDTFTEVATGEYRSGSVGHWPPSVLGGDPGFTFYDVCNKINIPEQNLVNLYSNLVKGVAGESYVDPETKVITMQYTICFSDCREYFVTYTPIN
jgi:hypothetical protein